MTDDVIYSTQYYVKYINRAILANLWHRPLKLGRLIVFLKEIKHTYGYQKFCSHGKSLFSCPYSLDFNVLVIFSSKSIKQGHKLKLTYYMLAGSCVSGTICKYENGAPKKIMTSCATQKFDQNLIECMTSSLG